jgi:hypothetical protein
MKNAISFFLIPVTDMDRAIKFYNSILSADLKTHEAFGALAATLPHDSENEGVGGALFLGDNYKPSTEGTCVILSLSEDLDEVLVKVTTAGGKILMPKTQVPNSTRFTCRIIDSEGNRIGLDYLP